MSDQSDDAAALREHLLAYYNTDFGANDDQLAAHAEEAKAYVGGRRWSWKVIAGERIKEAWEGPKP